MACCILGALVIAQAALVWRWAVQRWKTIWISLSFVLGISFVAAGALPYVTSEQVSSLSIPFCSSSEDGSGKTKLISLDNRK